MGKITINSKELLKEVKILLPVTQRYAIMPITEMILFKSVNGKKIELTANNNHIQIAREVDCLNSGNIDVCLPAKTLHDLLSKLPDVGIELIFENIKCSVKTTLGRYSITGEPGKDFMESKDVGKGVSFEIDSGTFKRQISNASMFASSDEIDARKRVVNFEIIDNVLTCAGSGMGDKNAIAALGVSQSDGLEIEGNHEFNIDNSCIEVVKRSIPNNGKIFIFFSDKVFWIKFEKTLIACGKVDLRWFPWKSILPSFGQTAKVRRNGLIGLIERVGLFSNEGLISTYWNGEKLTIEGSQPMDLGNAREDMKIESSIQMKAGFNSKYFLSVLKSLDGEMIEITAKDERSALLISNESKTEIRLLMPYVILNK